MHVKFAKKFIMMFAVIGMTLVIAGVAAPQVYADTIQDGPEMDITQGVEDYFDDEPTDDPADDPTDIPGDDPADDPTDIPADDPADDPGDDPTDEPSDDPSDIPGDDPTDEPSDDPAEPKTGWHEGFYYDAAGNKVVSQIVQIDGLVYIFDARGDSDLYNDLWTAADGKIYLIREGAVDKDTVYVYGGKLYQNGSLYTGVYQYVYYKNGVKSTAYKSVVQKVNDKFYYFTANGSIYKGTNWLRLDGKRYYIKSGDVCTGWQYIGGYKYYFYKSTAYLCQDLIAAKVDGIDWKTRVTHIKVNRTKNCVTLYAKDGANGNIIPVKSLICSVGLPGTPTITGTYTLSASRTYRWGKLGGPDMGGYVWGQYCTRISGSYLFHSVTYRNENDPRSLIASAYNNLGNAASHGCVRLQVIDAKLIYDIVNLKKNTVTVTIYDSSTVGPFDKPTIKKIPSSQKYEPTDPNIKK